MRRLILNEVVFTLTLIVPTLAMAQPTPLDPADFQANSYTTSHQLAPAVAVDPEGNFVLAWQSDGSPGSDTSYSIVARRFAADGTPIGTDFQVNTYTPGTQSYPAVAVDPEGNFVVAWIGDDSGGSDTSGDSIHARRFAADGTPLGDDFQVNTYVMGNQRNPSVAVDSAGNFVVAWNGGSDGTDTGSDSIQARRFAADGAPLGDDFQVNTYTPDHQTAPTVAFDAQGFVVAWHTDAAVTDSIHARRFDLDGTPIGDDYQVNTHTSSTLRNPTIAATPGGSFIVAWNSATSSGNDNSDGSIQARRFGADGLPIGDDFQVNTYTTDEQRLPTAGVDPEGNFIVAWQSEGSSGTDQDSDSILARRFGADGSPVDSDFQVNSYTTGSQAFPAVAVTPEGNFVATWHSEGSDGSDLDGYSIQARRFGRPTIVVNSTLGDTGGPDCKLRDALTAANTGNPTGGCIRGKDGARIVLPAGATITLTEADNDVNGLPVVKRPVTLEGNGSRIERTQGAACVGAGEFRLFEVVDGGILNLEEVTLANGCVSGEGGAITNEGTVVLRTSTIEDSAASEGGGLASTGNVFAVDSTLRDNDGGDFGGAVAVDGTAPFTLLRRSTFSGNSASTGGGLLLNGRALLTNVTVSGNSATSRGGGIAVAGSDALVTVTTSTLTDNDAPTAAGLDLQVGETRLHDSLVGDNAGPDCGSTSGTLEASGANLDTDGSCEALTVGSFTTVGSLGLGPLAASDGPTLTHMPLLGSPAIDAAPGCATEAGAPLLVDQRGVERPVDGDGIGLAECDLGAVENNLLFADGFETGDTSRW